MLITPTLLLLILILLQVALHQHASHVVTAAAQHGAVEAQREAGSPDGGRSVVEQFLARTGRGLVQRPSIRVRRDPERTQVVVDGTVVSIVPGFNFRVRGAAEGPTERFRALTER